MICIKLTSNPICMNIEGILHILICFHLDFWCEMLVLVHGELCRTMVNLFPDDIDEN